MSEGNIPRQHHEFTVLPDETEGNCYWWICSCGDTDEWPTYHEATDDGEHHLAVKTSVCADLDPGVHWCDLILRTAAELAGDGREPFPDELTDDEIHQFFKHARAMAAAIEPGLAQMCADCRGWELAADIVPRGH